ncbi:MAG: hypothetical protein KatS3mg076_0765 [Candidatus Binatia bacterium]|nr:MAG: hypothetical protein KatS3mg076_0765 [Candidatus Binatia bacterium]
MARRLLNFLVRHRVPQWSLLALQVILLGTLFGFLTALADRTNRRFDLTPYQTYVLSEQARRVAEGVRFPVRILVFFNGREPGQRRQLADVLEQFRLANANIRYELHDLDRSPGLAKKYGIGGYNTGIVEGNGRQVELPSVDEISITAALLKIRRETPRVLCFLTGHGEHDPMDVSERRGYSEVAKDLEREQFEIRKFDFAPTEEELSSCTVVVLAGPQRDLLEAEVRRLSAFLRSGGRVLVLADPASPPTLAAFLREFGVRLGENLLVDERNRLYGADVFMARVPIFDEETFRSKLELAAVFPLAQSVEPDSSASDAAGVTLLALSSPESWARIGTTQPEDGIPRFRPRVDRNGPLPVGVLVNVGGGKNGERRTQGQLAVFGDSDFASNLYLNLMGNKDLFMSTLALLAEDEELVVMRRKRLPAGAFSPIFLTERQGQIVFTVSVIVVPAVILAVGSVLVFVRKRQGR